MENLIKSTKIEFKFLYFKLHKYYLDTKMGNMILTGFENANESRKNEPARIRQMEQEKQAAHARMMEGYAKWHELRGGYRNTRENDLKRWNEEICPNLGDTTRALYYNWSPLNKHLTPVEKQKRDKMFIEVCNYVANTMWFYNLALCRNMYEQSVNNAWKSTKHGISNEQIYGPKSI